MKNIIIITVILCLYGCCKDDAPSSGLTGKLKTLTIIDNYTNSQRQLTCLYDSMGEFYALTSDSLSFTFTTTSSNYAFLDIDVLATDPIFNSKQKLKFNISPIKQVENIYLVDSILQTETLLSNVFYNNHHTIDSVKYAGNSNFVHDIVNSNYNSDGQNYIQQDISWNIFTILGGDRHYVDTITYLYTNFTNNNYIPQQIPLLETGYALLGSTQNNLHFYLAQLKGYSLLNKNKNLIKTVKSKTLGFITNYEYSFNSKNQVIEMRVSKPDGNGTALMYKMTYY
ncbi:MAG TPA: hypothetical protein PKO18_04240 [Chitinophagales bacterium]|nr:hypothetical protein [Chitinophagales bacterium]HNL84426.1 hypothetical protein [Chitinophagales bacterium]